MPRFAFTNRISLEFAGPQWKDAFIEFSVMTWQETKDFVYRQSESKEDSKRRSSVAIEQLKKQFVAGKAAVIDDKGDVSLQPLKADDIPDLPVDIINYLVGKLGHSGVTVPKESDNSSGTSSTPESETPKT